MKGLYSNNALVRSGQYARILNLFNVELQTKGHVNKSKFFHDVVAPSVPNYKLKSWLAFTKRIENDASVMVARATGALTATSPETAKAALTDTMMDSATATHIGIARALNIGAEALQEILEHPERLSPKDRAELLMKAMRAQDSRVTAISRVRRDSREQVVFEHVFAQAAYSEDGQ